MNTYPFQTLNIISLFDFRNLKFYGLVFFIDKNNKTLLNDKINIFLLVRVKSILKAEKYYFYIPINLVRFQL
jgi:hypothetical protein